MTKPIGELDNALGRPTEVVAAERVGGRRTGTGTVYAPIPTPVDDRPVGLTDNQWLVLQAFTGPGNGCIDTTARALSMHPQHVRRTLESRSVIRALIQQGAIEMLGLWIQGRREMRAIMDDPDAPAAVKAAVWRHVDEKMTGKAPEALLPQADDLDMGEVLMRLQTNIHQMGGVLKKRIEGAGGGTGGAA